MTPENKVKGKQRKGLQFISFVKEGWKGKSKEKKEREQIGIIASASDWSLHADLGKQLAFPADIIDTNLRPDLILFSRKTTQVVLLELTVPWEDRMEEANERKRMKYQELVSRCREKGWKTWYFPVEVGCRGFIGQTLWKALGQLGVTGKKRRK
ncbi:hypothetical protein Bbelb_415640 [Branchiostoma belcheri]|nr:hypothetical protein Bbelb_415640 [Branchiostoma belcheri]